jgi:hypothetical protein
MDPLSVLLESTPPCAVVTHVHNYNNNLNPLHGAVYIGVGKVSDAFWPRPGVDTLVVLAYHQVSELRLIAGKWGSSQRHSVWMGHLRWRWHQGLAWVWQ